MKKWLRELWRMNFSRQMWFVRYPDKAESMPFTYYHAKVYQKLFGGRIYPSKTGGRK